MGEETVYYVPRDQDRWRGCSKELVTSLFHAGVPLGHESADHLRNEYRRRGAVIPDCGVDLSCATSGVTDHSELLPVPHHLWDVCCPACGAEIVSELYGSWSKADTDAPIADRPVSCSACGQSAGAAELRYGEPMTFASVFVWFSDASRDQWPAELRDVIEQIVGPVDVFWDWTT